MSQIRPTEESDPLHPGDVVHVGVTNTQLHWYILESWLYNFGSIRA